MDNNYNFNEQKETAQFEELYTTYFTLVFGLAKKFFPHMAKDFTADFFVNSFKSIIQNGYFEICNEAFVYTCASNYFRTAYRKMVKKQTVSIDFLKEGSYTDTYDSRMGSQFSSQFELSLRKLTSREQKILLMPFEGYSDEDIGKIVECSVNNVSKVRGRAIEKLKKIYNL